MAPRTSAQRSVRYGEVSASRNPAMRMRNPPNIAITIARMTSPTQMKSAMRAQCGGDGLAEEGETEEGIR